MIEVVELINFKAFERFTADFHGTTYVVGPNNAGKSTVLNAIRSCAGMLRHATRRRARTEKRIDGVELMIYEFRGDTFLSPHENLRHEFRNDDTELKITVTNGYTLRALWPRVPRDREDPLHGFFYLIRRDGYQPNDARAIEKAFPIVGIVPQLSPLDQDEPVLEPSYVRKNLDTRLASRHFRNQLLQLEYRGREGATQFAGFKEFAGFWTPEISLEELQARKGESGEELDLFYKERGSRTVREIVWAGDGLQIWLQLLLHLFRLKDTSDVIVLDEPDVYLHADLQRRLVRLLNTIPAQIVTSTHSAEILSEADPEAIMWVDKSRSRALSGVRGSALGMLAQSLGSGFNLRLARALRTQHALFVEGNDMLVIGNWARILKLEKLAREEGVSIIPLGGESFSRHIEAFEWLASKLLENAMSIMTLLDRDYRCDSQVTQMLSELSRSSKVAHVWRRKELESYVLVPDAIARVSGADAEWVRSRMIAIAGTYEHDVCARMQDERMRAEGGPTRHRVSVTSEFLREFDDLWKDVNFRLYRAPPKEILAVLNRELVKDRKKAVSARSISKAMLPEEIPVEVSRILRQIEANIELDAAR